MSSDWGREGPRIQNTNSAQTPSHENQYFANQQLTNRIGMYKLPEFLLWAFFRIEEILTDSESACLKLKKTSLPCK